MEAITIGLDIAKNVFQTHGVDEAGEVVIRKRLRRSQMIPFFRKLGWPSPFNRLQVLS